jgi:ketosteroid isomerase-like protein
MPEESTTPDPVELAKQAFDALNRRDFEALERFYAPDAVLQLMAMGASFEGAAAIRGFCEDFVGSFKEYEIEPKEIVSLGNGIVFGVYLQQGRPTDSRGRVEMRAATVMCSVDGVVVRHMMYTDIDAARAAAQRLAEERR